MFWIIRAKYPEQTIRHLIEKWLFTQIANPGWKGKTVAGTCQGSVLSPLLANLYLHSFDREVVKKLPDGSLIRYADDFVILNQKRNQAETALNIAGKELGRLRLKLNTYKTKIVHFDEGFKFLGVFFLRNEHFVL